MRLRTCVRELAPQPPMSTAIVVSGAIEVAGAIAVFEAIAVESREAICQLRASEPPVEG